MSKSRNPSNKTVDRWINQGYGQGTGLAYKPFFYIRDVPSDGRSTILEGLKLPRKHHYLSDIEYHYHLLAEFSDAITEIREQFALLPREETQLIADQLGIEHPIYKSTGVQRVLTSDLVLSISRGNSISLQVLCCKAAADIDPANPTSTRTLEKLLIEKAFWDARNVEWQLVTDEMLPKNKVKNLDFFRGTMISRELDYLNPRMPEFLSAARADWPNSASLNDLLKTTSEALKIEIDHSFCLLGRAIWTKQLAIDLHTAPFSHEGPLPELDYQEPACSS